MDHLARFTRGTFSILILHNLQCFYNALSFIRKDNQSNELVAIKIINLENNWNAEDIDEVRHEISLLAHCSHPNIVQYRASFTVGTSLWTVMEYCALGSLRQLLVSHDDDKVVT